MVLKYLRIQELQAGIQLEYRQSQFSHTHHHQLVLSKKLKKYGKVWDTTSPWHFNALWTKTASYNVI